MNYWCKPTDVKLVASRYSLRACCRNEGKFKGLFSDAFCDVLFCPAKVVTSKGKFKLCDNHTTKANTKQNFLIELCKQKKTHKLAPILGVSRDKLIPLLDNARLGTKNHTSYQLLDGEVELCNVVGCNTVAEITIGDYRFCKKHNNPHERNIKQHSILIRYYSKLATPVKGVCGRVDCCVTDNLLAKYGDVFCQLHVKEIYDIRLFKRAGRVCGGSDNGADEHKRLRMLREEEAILRTQEQLIRKVKCPKHEWYIQKLLK